MKEKCTYNYKMNYTKMKHTHLVKFSFHFKKGKFQWYLLELVKCRVFCEEKQTKNCQP